LGECTVARTGVHHQLTGLGGMRAGARTNLTRNTGFQLNYEPRSLAASLGAASARPASVRRRVILEEGVVLERLADAYQRELLARHIELVLFMIASSISVRRGAHLETCARVQPLWRRR
jgi:hypothetical protein